MSAQTVAPGQGDGPAPSHWCYGWPLRLICAITVISYFLAGTAKIAGPLGTDVKLSVTRATITLRQTKVLRTVVNLPEVN